MIRIVLQYLCVALAGLVVGPFLRGLSMRVEAPTGEPGVPAMLGTSPVFGLVMLAGCLVIAGMMGVLASALVSRATGFFTAGVAFAWVAWAQGGVGELVRSTGRADIVMPLAIEGFVLGAVAVGCVWAIQRFARVRVMSDESAQSMPDERPIQWQAIGAAVSCIAGGAVALIVARTDDAAQVFGAAAAGTACGVGIARLVTSLRVTALWHAIGIALLAGIAPIAGSLLAGVSVESVYAAEISGLTRILPAQWIAGMLIGLPVGIAMGDSFVDRGMDAEAKR